MKINRHLVINRDGTTRMTVNPPELSVREIGCRLVIDVPDSFFRRPIPTVTVTFPDVVNDPEAVVRVVAQQVSESLGVDLDSTRDALEDLLAQQEDEPDEPDS